LVALAKHPGIPTISCISQPTSAPVAAPVDSSQQQPLAVSTAVISSHHQQQQQSSSSAAVTAVAVDWCYCSNTNQLQHQ